MSKEVKSKDFQILINRLEKDNKLMRDEISNVILVDYMNISEEEMEEWISDMEFKEELIDYHNMMINYVKKLDKELYGGN